MSARAIITFACLGACGKSGGTTAPAPAPGSANASAPAIDAGAPEPGPKPEVATSSIKIDLPPVPDFAFAADPGFTSLGELRTRGPKHLGEQVKVKGYVSWVYDCVDDLMQAGQDRAAVEKLIEADPTRCSRPYLYLSDTPDDSVATHVWVVDVPRPLRPYERKQLDAATIASWPKVPVFARGDQVVVTGTWQTRSPHGSANSDGLLVYASLEKVTP